MTRRLDEERFRDLYSSNFNALLAYALRRVTVPEEAADVVADTFLVAWRRRGTIPQGDEARLWLYGVARHMLANQHRGAHRRGKLAGRLRERLAASPHLYQPAEEDFGVQEALASLGSLDREVLTLSAWEQLDPREIAQVLGISGQAARARLSRARRRLRAALSHAGAQAGHVSPTRAKARVELNFEEGR